MSTTLEVGGLRFLVRRSARRTTLGLTVDRGGELILHAPERVDEEELQRWTHSRLLWVHRKLAEKRALTARVREPEFVSGESFSFLGRPYPLKLVAEQDVPLRLEGTRFLLRRDAQGTASEHFRRWYIEAGREWLRDRVRWDARRIGAAPARVEVRDLGFRWGSCGRSSAVFFNWRLLQLPVRLADYVIVHELGHLVEPHHGLEFSRLLDRALPDWRQRQDELRHRAQDLFWCHGRMMQ